MRRRSGARAPFHRVEYGCQKNPPPNSGEARQESNSGPFNSGRQIAWFKYRDVILQDRVFQCEAKPELTKRNIRGLAVRLILLFGSWPAKIGRANDRCHTSASFPRLLVGLIKCRCTRATN